MTNKDSIFKIGYAIGIFLYLAFCIGLGELLELVLKSYEWISRPGLISLLIGIPIIVFIGLKKPGEIFAKILIKFFKKYTNYLDEENVVR